MQITDLCPQRKNPKRVNLYLDDKFALGLDLETIAQENLAVGGKISEEELKRLEDLSRQQKLWEKALKFLSFRPRSEKEIRHYLVKKKVDEEEIRWVMDKLKEQGYINDEEFARWWIEQRQTFRPKGWRVLKQELRQKGVSQAIIEGIGNPFAGQAGQESGISELEMARRLAQKKYARFQNLPREKLFQKMGQSLLRRGFTWETVKKTIDEILKKE